jgi:hypothetical protein
MGHTHLSAILATEKMEGKKIVMVMGEFLIERLSFNGKGSAYNPRAETNILARTVESQRRSFGTQQSQQNSPFPLFIVQQSKT